MIKISKILKTKGIGFILLAFAAGIILLMLPQEKSEKKVSSADTGEYIARLEYSLESLLKSAVGKKCRVMITAEAGYSYSYAANETLNTTYDGEKTSSKNVSKEYVITTKDGVEQLVIIKENLPVISGVAVVCKSGGEWERETILTIVSSLFDIPKNSIGCITGN